MKSFTQGICYKQMRNLAALTVFILLCSSSTNAQFRNYGITYSDNIKGSTTMFGNTLEAIYESDNVTVDTTKMNDTRANGNSTYGNDNSNMLFVDVDGTTGAGASTYNSSSADLSLPAGTNTIKFARLYWGGRVLKSQYDISQTANQTVKLKTTAGGAYFTFTADHVDDTLGGSGSSAYYQYQAYVDVTQTVQNNGAGTYTIANVPLTPGNIAGGGYYGGWCIVVVYENLTAFSNYNSVRVYDGYQQVFNGGSPTLSTVTLTGLNVPSGALSTDDAKMGVMAWEGDANLTGDSLRINNHYFSNQINPIGNVFNGSISDSGVAIHTKNPDYNNQMSLDIDQFYVGTGYGIQPNDQTITLAFRTEADQYFPGLFTFVIKTKDPNPYINKAVTDSNGDHIAEAGELLTYDLTGANTGVGNANFTVISDTLASTVTYVPGSLKVIYSPGIATGSLTDASGDDQGEYTVNGSIKTVRFRVGTGANASIGGTLTDNDSFHVQFQVRVNTPAKGMVPPIVNVARVIAYSDANVPSIDDGTAILDPEAGPLPISLTSFAVTLSQSSEAKINWVTSLENGCKKYDVQRSTDGNMFNTVATVAGHGTTALQNSYSVTDDIAAVNSSVVYYRLVQVNADGKINYSKVIAVKLKGVLNGFTVSPNPFSSYVNVNLEWNKTETTNAKVYNMLGKVVLSKNIQLSKGSNYVSIDELSGLPSGSYLLQINSSDGSTVRKITKQ
jgi:uncharacterized repeat protein (TIGR01451 family)